METQEYQNQAEWICLQVNNSDMKTFTSLFNQGFSEQILSFKKNPTFARIPVHVLGNKNLSANMVPLSQVEKIQAYPFCLFFLVLCSCSKKQSSSTRGKTFQLCGLKKMSSQAKKFNSSQNFLLLQYKLSCQRKISNKSLKRKPLDEKKIVLTCVISHPDPWANVSKGKKYLHKELWSICILTPISHWQ